MASLQPDIAQAYEDVRNGKADPRASLRSATIQLTTPRSSRQVDDQLAPAGLRVGQERYAEADRLWIWRWVLVAAPICDEKRKLGGMRRGRALESAAGRQGL